jgi:hypothetical protein
MDKEFPQMKIKIFGLLVAVALVGGLVVFAAHATGAYFSDTHNGTITGTIGSIKASAGVNADTGGGLNFGFTNLLPGVSQTGTVYYSNSGTNPEDVYIVFPDADALHALNDLGSYGSVQIKSTGGVNWVSNNLTDFWPEGTPGINGASTLYYVPEQMLLQSNLPVGASGSMTFTFQYASKLGDATATLPSSSGGGAWNAYPVAAETKANGESYTPPYTVGTKSGLPYQIVATEVGQTPGPIVLPPLSPDPKAPW